MIRVAIADDHAMVRAGFRAIIGTCANIRVIGEASNGAELSELLRHVPVDLVLLDLNMPGISGEALVRSIREQHPNVPLLVLSGFSDTAIVARTLRLGVAGYVTKSSASETLLAAISKVAAGGRYIDPALVDAVVFLVSEAAPAAHTQLTAREMEVLEMIVAGTRLKEIARALGLSDKTISAHKTRLMRKLRVRNNAELVRYAMANKLFVD